MLISANNQKFVVILQVIVVNMEEKRWGARHREKCSIGCDYTVNDESLPFCLPGRTSVSTASAAPPFGNNNVKTNFLTPAKPASNGAVRYEHRVVYKERALLTA